jgi:hypothetical protein
MMEKYYYYAVVLTLNPEKKDVKDKSFETLSKKILLWVKNVKNIEKNLYSGPFYDVGDNNTNIHANLVVKSTLEDTEKIRNEYFKSWRLRKGYVSIKEIYNFKLWLEYAKRNHKLLENIENAKN